MTQRRRVKARYRVVGPKTETVTYTHCWIDEDTKSLQQEQRTREQKMFMVYFPQGHSIRVGAEELKRLGFDRKPRLVDMDTGDVLDPGGDPYDFGEEVDTGPEVILTDDVGDGDGDEDGLAVERTPVKEKNKG